MSSPDGNSHTSIKDALEKLDSAEYGQNYIIIYPDLQGYRKIYSAYTRKHLEERNEAVIILPFYETVDRVRIEMKIRGVDIAKYERNNFLVVKDSFEAYAGSQDEFSLFIQKVLRHASISGKDGLSIIIDMGSFHLIDKIRDMARNEMSMLSNTRLHVKGFCSYHKTDYDKMSKEKKEVLFSSNYQAIEISC